MSEAEKRARLTVAHDGIVNLRNAAHNGELLTRKDIFSPNVKRKNGSTRLDLEICMNKKPWQQELLKKLVLGGFIEEIRESGQMRYETVKIGSLSRLIENCEDENTHIFDADLRLSALLWPRDVIVPEVVEDPEDDVKVDDVKVDEVMVSDDSHVTSISEATPEEPVTQASLDENPLTDEEMAVFATGKGRRVILTLLMVQKTQEEYFAKTSTSILEVISKLSVMVKENFAAGKSRQTETEKAVSNINSSVQGLLRTVKDQLAAEITTQVLATLQTEKQAMVVEVQQALQPFYVQNQEQAAVIKELLKALTQTQNTKQLELVITMKKLLADFNAATSLFLEASDEVEANGNKSA
jgi:hypothetical protein